MSLESTSTTTMCGRENVKNNNKAAQARLSIFIYMWYIPYGIITTKSKTQSQKPCILTKWYLTYWGQNGDITLSCKLFNKMPMFWNYLGKYPCLKLDFLKLEFQWRTQFAQNRVIGKNLKKFTSNSSFWNSSSM